MVKTITFDDLAQILSQAANSARQEADKVPPAVGRDLNRIAIIRERWEKTAYQRLRDGLARHGDAAQVLRGLAQAGIVWLCPECGGYVPYHQRAQGHGYGGPYGPCEFCVQSQAAREKAEEELDFYARATLAPITAPPGRCSCYGRGDCAACQSAYERELARPVDLYLEYIEGGNVCAACSDAVRAEHAEDIALSLSARQRINALVGQPGVCQAATPCRWQDSHRYRWLMLPDEETVGA